MKYDNSEDAELYLSGSYVKYKGRAVLVRDVTEDMLAICVDVSTGKSKEIPVNDLDLSPFVLGYVYSERLNKCFYVERIPSRSWRQGLTSENCRAIGGGFFFSSADSYTLIDLFSNIYPSIQEAYAIAASKRREVPFNSEFTIDLDKVIRYKTKVIGEWYDSKFYLMSKFSFLKEMLEESVNEDN